MQRLTIGSVWAGMIAVVSRHFGVFATLMAAFAFLPALFVSLVLPDVLTVRPGPIGALPAIHPGFAPVLLILLTLQFAGMFAIVAIAADPAEGGGRSVGQTLVHGLPALVRFLLAGILVWIALALAVLVVGVVIGLGLGLGGTPANDDVRTLAAAMVLASMALTLWGGARLAPLPGLLLREGSGPVAGLRRAWALSRGATVPLVQLSLVYLVAALVLALVAQGLVAAFGLVGAALGGLRLGGFIASIASAAIGAWLSIYWGAALGVIYRQLAER